jgi:hypothetical protein
VTAMVLVYYGPTLSICDKWAESDSVFLKSGTRLVTNVWPENSIFVLFLRLSYEMSFAGGVFLLPPFFEFSSLSLSLSLSLFRKVVRFVDTYHRLLQE